MIRFSFIIPHKNAPKLLARCIDSIPNRNDVEIIVVDDASDDCVKELESLERKYKDRNCYFYFQQKSMGAGYARNVGIEKSKGYWLLFADADDFYTEAMNPFLDKYADDHIHDLIYLNSQIYKDDGSTLPLSFDKYIKRYNRNAFYSEKVLRYNMWTPWSRMVTKKLVVDNNIRYEEIPVGNDKMFCLLCSKYAKKIGAEISVCYNYYMPTSGSLTYTYCVKPENLKIKLALQLRSNILYDEVGYAFKSSLLYFYISSAKYEKNADSRRTYRDFFKANSISLIKDFYYLIKQVVGKIIGIL